ncbi:MAG: glycosyltransferase family 2 protein [Alphaproteobacteria bacterium]|nr:glycosyltransferase family 2 protein [Alphaproteobacteria bacterium]
MAAVDVVIVNYHSAAHAYTAIRSVHEVARADGVGVNVVVVNNSDDGQALAESSARGGGAEIVQNARNIGFGAACNLGAARGRAPVILFLNPDAALTAGCLRTCLGALTERVGIAGPELVDGEGSVSPSCSALPTVASLIGRTVGWHLIVPNAGFPYLPLAAHGLSGDVGQVMGAVMFVRRDVFEAVKGFDESYFLYFEDVDLSARAHDAGWRSRYVKEARAVHLGAGSSGAATGMALALHAASRVRYSRQYFGLPAAFAVAVLASTFEFPVRMLRAALRGDSVVDVFAGWRLWLGHALFGADIVQAAGRP